MIYDFSIFEQALCLSPTYELAVQTGEVVAKMASYCPDITIKYALRGEESKFIFSNNLIGNNRSVTNSFFSFSSKERTGLSRTIAAGLGWGSNPRYG